MLKIKDGGPKESRGGGAVRETEEEDERLSMFKRQSESVPVREGEETLFTQLYSQPLIRLPRFLSIAHITTAASWNNPCFFFFSG